MADKPSVQEAITEAMKEIRAIGKNQSNQQQRFMYRGIEDVRNGVRPALEKTGLHYRPLRTVVYRYDEGRTKNGTLQHVQHVTVTFRMTGPAGDFEDSEVIALGIDMGDKGPAKAMSYAEKQYLTQVFCIPTDEMDEGDPEPGQARLDFAQIKEQIDQASTRGPEALEALLRIGSTAGWPEGALGEVRARIAQLRSGE